MRKIAVYGSLKEGFYNHTLIKAGGRFLGHTSVKDVMYLRWSYPALFHTDGYGSPFSEDMVREHPVEVYEVTESVFERINNMELGAGYEPEEIETPFGEAVIWYMPHRNLLSSDEWIEGYTQELLSR